MSLANGSLEKPSSARLDHSSDATDHHLQMPVGGTFYGIPYPEI